MRASAGRHLQLPTAAAYLIRRNASAFFSSYLNFVFKIKGRVSSPLPLRISSGLHDAVPPPRAILMPSIPPARRPAWLAVARRYRNTRRKDQTFSNSSLAHQMTSEDCDSQNTGPAPFSVLGPGELYIFEQRESRSLEAAEETARMFLWGR